MNCILKVQSTHDVDVDGIEEQLQQAAYWLLDKMDDHLHRANEYCVLSMDYASKVESCGATEEVLKARYESKRRMYDKLREENLRECKAAEETAYILGLTVVQLEVTEEDK